MKKVFVLVFALAVASVAMSGTDAGSKSTPGVAVVKEGSTFKLFYKSLQRSDVTVTIYNASKKIVFFETIRNSDGFIRPYNFEKLTEGKYTFELKDAEGKHKKHVLHEDILSVNSARIVKMQNEEKYALLIPNKKPEEISIGIYDGEGREIYYSKEKVDIDFARMFDLKGLSGSFIIILIDSAGRMKTISR